MDRERYNNLVALTCFFEQLYETFNLDFYFILSKNFDSGFLLFLTPHWHLSIYFAFFLN